MLKKIKGVMCAVAPKTARYAAVAVVLFPFAARADYTVPAYLTDAITAGGVAIAALTAAVAVVALTAKSGTAGLRFVLGWIGKLFR